MYVWSDYLAFPELGWSQCLQVNPPSPMENDPCLLQMWDIARNDPTFASLHQISLQPTDEMDYETLYSFMHVMLVFWCPVAIIMVGNERR